MDQGIYTAAAGAIAMEDRLNVISNNIANLNTTGFKKDQDELREVYETAGYLFPVPRAI